MNKKGSSPFDTKVSVRLMERDWFTILDILQKFSIQKGGVWVDWQKSVEKIIRTSIDKVESKYEDEYDESDVNRSEFDDDYEIGRRLAALEEGDFDYDGNGNLITDPDYYIP